MAGRFSLLDADGVTWEIESNSVSILRRMDLSADLFTVRNTIRIAGSPALDGRRLAYVVTVTDPATFTEPIF